MAADESQVSISSAESESQPLLQNEDEETEERISTLDSGFHANQQPQRRTWTGRMSSNLRALLWISPIILLSAIRTTYQQMFFLYTSLGMCSPHPGPNPDCLKKIVGTRRVASFLLLLGTLLSIGCWTYLGDLKGKKRILFWIAIGSFILDAIPAIWFPISPPDPKTYSLWMLIDSLLKGLLGGPAGFSALVYAYVIDGSRPESRSTLFSLVLASTSLAEILATLLVGLITSNGYWTVYSRTRVGPSKSIAFIVCTTISLLYLAFVLPEKHESHGPHATVHELAVEPRSMLKALVSPITYWIPDFRASAMATRVRARIWRRKYEMSLLGFTLLIYSFGLGDVGLWVLLNWKDHLDPVAISSILGGVAIFQLIVYAIVVPVSAKLLQQHISRRNPHLPSTYPKVPNVQRTLALALSIMSLLSEIIVIIIVFASVAGIAAPLIFGVVIPTIKFGILPFLYALGTFGIAGRERGGRVGSMNLRGSGIGVAIGAMTFVVHLGGALSGIISHFELDFASGTRTPTSEENLFIYSAVCVLVVSLLLGAAKMLFEPRTGANGAVALPGRADDDDDEDEDED